MRSYGKTSAGSQGGEGCGEEYRDPEMNGAPGRIRTCDFQLRRLTLYPLSYGRK